MKKEQQSAEICRKLVYEIISNASFRVLERERGKASIEFITRCCFNAINEILDVAWMPKSGGDGSNIHENDFLPELHEAKTLPLPNFSPN